MFSEMKMLWGRSVGASVVLVLLLVSIFSQVTKNTGERGRSSVFQELISVFHAVWLKFLSVFLCQKSGVM